MCLKSAVVYWRIFSAPLSVGQQIQMQTGMTRLAEVLGEGSFIDLAIVDDGCPEGQAQPARDPDAPGRRVTIESSKAEVVVLSLVLSLESLNRYRWS